MICFFLGHRDAQPHLMPHIEAAVNRHITEYGVTQFIVGQYGAFDRMAAGAVLRAKQQHPEVKLSILLPYHPSERTPQTPQGYDDTFYPPKLETVPRRFAIVSANRYMIQHSDYLITYAWQPGSNSRKFLEFARRQPNLTITELPHL